MPSAGPIARNAKAQVQPIYASIVGIRRIVTRVNKKPRLVCRVRAVPVYSLLQSSLIAAENWAESATMAKPQTRHTQVSRMGFLPKSRPAVRQQAPLTKRERMVTV